MKQDDTIIHMNEKPSHSSPKLTRYIWGGGKVAGTSEKGEKLQVLVQDRSHHPSWHYLTFFQKAQQRSQVLMSSKLIFGFYSVEHLSVWIIFFLFNQGHVLSIDRDFTFQLSAWHPLSSKYALKN